MEQKKGMKRDEILKKEALERMQLLKISPEVIDVYAKENKVMVSWKGVFSELSVEEERIIHEFEEKTRKVVFHVISSHMLEADLLEVLFVSRSRKGWKVEKEWIRKYSEVYCKAFNLTTPEYSEFGCIRVRNICGSLCRVA